MKKKIFYLISIFIFCFSFAFSFFDKVSFAADTYTNHCIYNGTTYSWTNNDNFRPFVLIAHTAGYSYYKSCVMCGPVSSTSANFSITYPTEFHNKKYRAIVKMNDNGIPSFSCSPGLPMIERNFNSFDDIDNYILKLIDDPSQIPINVNSHDSNLGSLELASSDSWRILSTSNAESTALYQSQRVFKSSFKDVTSTGKSYDKIQVMYKIYDIHAQLWFPYVPKSWNVSRDMSYSNILPELYDPPDIQLDILKFAEDKNHYEFGIFQDFLTEHNVSQVMGQIGSVKFSYDLAFRPVSSSGVYGDWIYFNFKNDLQHDALYGTGTIPANVYDNVISSDDPSSTAVDLNGDPHYGITPVGLGTDLPSANNNANNTFINNYNGSDDSLISNIKGLFSYFVGLPDIISTLFSWLPSWVLSLFAIGFALFVPIFIYKFVRG